MSQLSAADLQKKHTLEGTPDPFPSLTNTPAKPAANGRSARGGSSTVDTNSETAFPSLAPANPKKPGSGGNAWGAAPRIQSPRVQAPGFTESFDLGQIDLKAAGKDGKPTTLGEIMRQVMAKSGATIEASTQRNTGRTTFVVKGQTEKSLDLAKRLLVSNLSPVVSLRGKFILRPPYSDSAHRSPRRSMPPSLPSDI